MSDPTASGVVVVGIDGVRLDTLREVRTPTIDAIAAAGFFAPFDVCQQAPSDSGPAWTTVATGVLPEQHRVFGNDFAGNRIADHPDFLTRVARAGTGPTFAAAAWPPIVGDADGGPVTAFVYFGAPDEIAHDTGVSAAYRAAIEASDGLVGEITVAVRGRASYDVERWTFIVVTDHGHLDAGGHGGDTDVERTAWMAACGSDAPAAPPAHLGHADVAAHALHALGMEIDPAWALDGRPLHQGRNNPER